METLIDNSNTVHPYTIMSQNYKINEYLPMPNGPEDPICPRIILQLRTVNFTLLMEYVGNTKYESISINPSIPPFLLFGNVEGCTLSRILDLLALCQEFDSVALIKPLIAQKWAVGYGCATQETPTSDKDY